ncbi:MAG: BrnA antitoxin family protein [Desulfovermiculus sp.]|nr:BrnA antitoxin family protein [Desulfovermiculus sp.]
MKSKSEAKWQINVPDPEENTAINAGIDADPDTYELSEQEFKHLRRVGRPPATITKERVTIRLSPDVVGSFRSTGTGWQTRINNALRDWLREHKPTEANGEKKTN